MSSDRAHTARSPRRSTRVLRAAVLAVLIGATLGAGVRWVLEQSVFRVQHVTFTGLRHETTAQAMFVSGLERHPTMFGLSVSSVRHNLARFAWIDSVTLSKRWPNTVVVRVVEATPVAVAFDVHHQLRYVDARGRDLGAAPLTANLPLLDDVNPTGSTWPFTRAGYNAAYVASQLPRAFASQVAQVRVNAHGVVTLKLTTPVSFILGVPTDLQEKFVAIASVIKHSTLVPGSVVDVTVPGELAVSAPGTG